MHQQFPHKKHKISFCKQTSFKKNQSLLTFTTSYDIHCYWFHAQFTIYFLDFIFFLGILCSIFSLFIQYFLLLNFCWLCIFSLRWCSILQYFTIFFHIFLFGKTFRKVLTILIFFLLTRFIPWIIVVTRNTMGLCLHI